MKTPLLITSALLLALLATIGAALPYPILAPLFAAGASNGLNTFLGLPAKLLFGLALTINPLGLLIGSALLGPMSDRYGRRPVLLVSAIGSAIGHAVTAAALVLENYPLFIIARLGTGLLEGSGSVARALLADRLDGELRRKALSWLNGAFYMGWLAGPLLAGATLQFGITTPFWVAVAALLLVAGLVAATLPPEAPRDVSASWWQVARDRHALNLLRDPDLRSLFIVTLAYTSGVTAFYEFYPLWLVEVPGYGPQGIAWTTAAMCAVMTATTVAAGRPFNGEPLLHARRYAMVVAALIATLAAGNAAVGLACIVLYGIPHACYNAIVPNYCAERFGGVHGQGAVMGLISTTFCLANILMALAGAVLTLIDTRLILLLGAGLTAWSSWRMQGLQRSMAARVERVLP
ncbi:MFS transporter [Duganella callida]|uniref:MFS transporter n=1 Tax=Duganella callida TaxID=2561932 RepID=A0A4Y9SXK1_9BURK|nr:MFS transporter [Duganella callida]TFW30079.1 MFS transporter [Duganella callida]